MTASSQVRTVTELLAKIKDIARPNMFEVEFKHTELNGNPYLTIVNEMVRTVEAPSISIGEIIVRRMGRRLILPGTISFSDFIMSLHNDVEGKIRNFFLQWQKGYYGNLNEGTFTSSVAEYIKGEVVIYQLDGNHERKVKTVLKKAYPKLLGTVEYSHDQEDALGSFSVGFSYSYIQISNQHQSNFDDLDNQNDFTFPG